MLPKVEETMREENKGTTQRILKESWCAPEFDSLFVQKIPHVSMSFPWNSSLSPPFPRRHTENFGEHSGTEKGTGSTYTLHRDPGHTSANTELFTPELVENGVEDRNMDEYRFLCPHAGQFICKFTNLVFDMEGKGEVLYRIVPWDDSVLDGLGQKEPAGPLYSIECLEGSIQHLHFPHCETCKDKVKPTAAHVTGGNVEIIQPLTVTNTHVIIKIQSLSCFGLTLHCSGSPIRAQVLLFYKKMTDHRINKLHIHLLPANVPVKEVQKQHESYTYIETTSNCDLTPGKKYRPRCKSTDHEYAPKPEVVKFHRDLGPNYHPTFEVSLNIEAAEVTLILLDKRGKQVWTPPKVLLTGTARASLRLDSTGADFVDTYSEKLIQRVSTVMEIADYLKGKEMISNEIYSNIKVKATSQDKMRELYTCLDSGGRSMKREFYKILREKESFLMDDLSQA